MTNIKDIGTKLLGCLEAVLFMPETAKRFGSSYDEMIRSFMVPVIVFPLSLLAVYLCPKPEMADQSHVIISMLYSLRFAFSLGIFLGFVYFIAAKIERTEHFFQFVTANNWLALPSAIISVPILMLLTQGDAHAAQEAEVLSLILVFYTYTYTAFTAACILRIPIELAGFIAMTGLIVNNSTHDILGWLGSVL
jgi:hypothetical protein